VRTLLFALMFSTLVFAGVTEYESLRIYVGGGGSALIQGSCVGARQGLPPSLSACQSVYSDVKKAAEQLGYASACNDPNLLMLFSKLYQESSCNPAGIQGLFQIPDCEKKGGCAYEENIELGLKKSISNCLAVKRALPNQDTETITEATLFAYNRGEGTLARAVSLYKQEVGGGADWTQSMVRACQTEYDRGSYEGCGGFDRNACCGLPGYHDGERHSGNGLGSRYGEKIISIYWRACLEQGGRLT